MKDFAALALLFTIPVLAPLARAAEQPVRGAPVPGVKVDCNSSEVMAQIYGPLKTVAKNEAYFQTAGAGKLEPLYASLGETLQTARACVKSLPVFPELPLGDIDPRHEWIDIQNKADFIRTAIRLRLDQGKSAWDEDRSYRRALDVMHDARSAKDPDRALVLADQSLTLLDGLSDGFMAYNSRVVKAIGSLCDDAKRIIEPPPPFEDEESPRRPEVKKPPTDEKLSAEVLAKARRIKQRDARLSVPE
ncbi:MAG: hypothetical protein NTY77_19055 [Elusimicrobia bacterium]|nr:hypothetical protein [Elusimicrobiota bacterium]